MIFTALNHLLPPDNAPFSLREIALTLEVDEECVRRAWESLRRRGGTQKIVEPVDQCRPVLLTDKGAQRVARYILSRWSLDQLNDLLRSKNLPVVSSKDSLQNKSQSLAKTRQL